MTPPRAPRVTVLTTVLNGAPYLDEAIESVLRQTFSDFEYVVVDDGSTDATPVILEAWRARDSRLVVLRNDTNRGIPASANAGLAVARGDYVARLDADDVCEPDRLQREVDVLDARPDVALVSMNHLIMRVDGVVLRKTSHHAPSEVVEHLLQYGNAVGAHSVTMYRRRAAATVGGYDVRYALAQDYDLWTRLAREGRVVVLREAGARYRLHPDSVTTSKAERLEREVSEIAARTLRQYLGREIASGEIVSLTTLWSRSLRLVPWRPADRLLAEGYAIFCSRHGDPSLRRRVRQEYARRFGTMGMALVRDGRPAEGAAHLAAAVRWDPVESIRTLLRITCQAARYLWLMRAPSEPRPL